MYIVLIPSIDIHSSACLFVTWYSAICSLLFILARAWSQVGPLQLRRICCCLWWSKIRQFMIVVSRRRYETFICVTEGVRSGLSSRNGCYGVADGQFFRGAKARKTNVVMIGQLIRNVWPMEPVVTSGIWLYRVSRRRVPKWPQVPWWLTVLWTMPWLHRWIGLFQLKCLTRWV